MKLICKKCGKKLRSSNKKGYCKECLKLGIVALGIYKCIEPNCKNEVSEPDRRCIKCASFYRGKHHKGKNNGNWKGGITPLSRIIKNSDEYRQWRTKVFERESYTCQECTKRGGKLEAHHKKRFSIILDEFLHQYSQFSPIEDKETLVRLAMTYEPFWDISNGITLCKKCHDKTRGLIKCRLQ